MNFFLPRRLYIINASLLATYCNDTNEVDFSVTSMSSKLILKIFVRLKVFFYEESFIKLQLQFMKGKVWRELLQLKWVWERWPRIWLAPLRSGPAVTGKGVIPASVCVLQQQVTTL